MRNSSPEYREMTELERIRTELLKSIEFDDAYPPTEFTSLLITAGSIRIESRISEGLRCNVIAELGAKEGYAGLCLFVAHKCQSLVATDIFEHRVDMIKRNFAKFGLPADSVILSRPNEWFPTELSVAHIDIFLANPPSIPKPENLVCHIEDMFVYFAGRDGRLYLSQLIQQASQKLTAESDLIVVGTDYVLDEWIEEACAANSLKATAILRQPCFSGKDGVDFLIREHIKSELGWRKFQESDDGIYFEKVAYLICKNNRK